MRTLVAIDSGTYNTTGVNAVADWMAARLAALGCQVTRYAGYEQGLGDCLAARLAGRGSARIFVSGHMDTVYPDGTALLRPLRLEKGHAIGPGACDMKGGLLAGLYALKALQDLGFDDYGEVLYFCSSDEEINSVVSQQLYLPLARQAKAALVLEAGWPVGTLPYGALTVARKGGGRFELHVTGVEAHAGSEFDRGASAILALAHKVDALCALTNRWPGVTVNVGIVRGGATYNTVAGRAYADVDVRVGCAKDIPALAAAIQEIADRVDIPGTATHLEGSIVKPPMEPSASGTLAKLAQREAAALGFPLAEFTSGGTSDASYLASAGIPVLDGLGPVGAKDHSPDEYLLVDSVVPRTALLVRLIMALAAADADT